MSQFWTRGRAPARALACDTLEPRKLFAAPEMVGETMVNSGSNPQGFINDGDASYFIQLVANEGWQPFRIDAHGNVARWGKYVGTGSEYSLPSAPPSLSLINNRLICQTRNGTFVTDGTDNYQLRMPEDGTAFFSGRTTRLGDQLILFASNATNTVYGLYATDGTQAGTSQLMSVRGGTGPNHMTLPWNRIVDGSYFFFARDPATGFELYRTDGTAAGTSRVTDLRAGATDGVVMGVAGGGMQAPFVVGDQLYFSAYGADGGRYLYSSDGTAAGTRVVSNVPLNYAGAPSQLAPFQDGVLFKATDAAGGQVHYYSGVTGVTTPLADTRGDAFYFGWGGPSVTHCYYSRINGPTLELWKSDGTATGTFKVFESTQHSAVSGYYPASQLYFALHRKADGVGELWTTDGMSSNTRQLTGRGATANVAVSILAVMDISDQKVVFTASDPLRGNELWVTDGTAEGTVPLPEAVPGAAGLKIQALRWRRSDGVYFVADDGTHGAELWRYHPDLDAPHVVPQATGYGFDEQLPAVQITFDDDLLAPLTLADLTLFNLDTGTEIGPNQIVVNFDPQTKSASVRSTGSRLEDGRYRLTLHAANVRDDEGNRMATDETVDFFVLTGDSNRDGAVNFIDLVTLARNYGKNERRFSEGDFNYDGTVAFADLLLLAKNYGQILLPPALTLVAVSTGSRRRMDNVCDVLA